MTPKPEDRCAMGEAVLFLSGGLAFLAGIAIAVLSVRSWIWGD